MNWKLKPEAKRIVHTTHTHTKLMMDRKSRWKANETNQKKRKMSKVSKTQRSNVKKELRSKGVTGNLY